MAGAIRIPHMTFDLRSQRPWTRCSSLGWTGDMHVLPPQTMVAIPILRKCRLPTGSSSHESPTLERKDLKQSPHVFAYIVPGSITKTLLNVEEWHSRRNDCVLNSYKRHSETLEGASLITEKTTFGKTFRRSASSSVGQLQRKPVRQLLNLSLDSYKYDFLTTLPFFPKLAV